jgi:hypothetical protein
MEWMWTFVRQDSQLQYVTGHHRPFPIVGFPLSVGVFCDSQDIYTRWFLKFRRKSFSFVLVVQGEAGAAERNHSAKEWKPRPWDG